MTSTGQSTPTLAGFVAAELPADAWGIVGLGPTKMKGAGKRTGASPPPNRVGMTGFEPATLRSQSGCATKLRHIPGPPPGGCVISLAGHAKLATHPGTSGGTRV